MSDIFERLRLRPSQLRTIAERRFDDAAYLCASGLYKHANGAMYVGGFVIECLLKATLIEKYRWLAHPTERGSLSPADQRVFDLCYRWHDLAGLIEQMPEIPRQLLKADRTGRLSAFLRDICASWTVFARYSPRMTTMVHARRFWQRVQELKPCLK